MTNPTEPQGDGLKADERMVRHFATWLLEAVRGELIKLLESEGHYIAAEIVDQHLSDKSLAALTPKPSEEQRERIARIIDPDLWESYDYLASLPDAIMDAVARVVAPSLAKADAILSLPQERIAEGWVLVPRVMTNAMFKALSGSLPKEMDRDDVIGWEQAWADTLAAAPPASDGGQ